MSPRKVRELPNGAKIYSNRNGNLFSLWIPTVMSGLVDASSANLISSSMCIVNWFNRHR